MNISYVLDTLYIMQVNLKRARLRKKSGPISTVTEKEIFSQVIGDVDELIEYLETEVENAVK